jgi:serine/threonine-protein kinase
VRPNNIFIEERPATRDFVKLADFGLAKVLAPSAQLSPAGQTIGDLEYNSPEQLLQRPIDARSDLYALGVLGFRLVTGYHPLYGARTVGELVAATIQHVPPPASQTRPDLAIASDVDHILARLLEKDPERRFPDTTSLGAMLRVALATRMPETTDTMRESELEVDDADVVGEE